MMRLAIWRTAAVVVVAALVVAACGSQRDAPPATTRATPPVAGQDGPAAFVARARQVTAQWDRSAAARVWRAGLVLMGPCDAAWGAYRYESNTTVVAGSWEKPSPGNAPCPAVGMPRIARVRLARPLGTRVLLDVASGLPLVSGYQIP